MTLDELQDRVIQLEQELIDAQEKHDEELEMEKVGWCLLFLLVCLFNFFSSLLLHYTPWDFPLISLTGGYNFFFWKSPMSGLSYFYFFILLEMGLPFIISFNEKDML